MGTPASFGPFRPASARTTRPDDGTVISTAGDATLTVADPSTTATGKLVNGAFSFNQPLRRYRALRAAGPRARSPRRWLPATAGDLHRPGLQ